MRTYRWCKSVRVVSVTKMVVIIALEVSKMARTVIIVTAMQVVMFRTEWVERRDNPAVQGVTVGVLLKVTVDVEVAEWVS